MDRAGGVSSLDAKDVSSLALAAALEFDPSALSRSCPFIISLLNCWQAYLYIVNVLIVINAHCLHA
jgi:hypothetical protein